MSELFNVLNLEQDTSLAPAPQRPSSLAPVLPTSNLIGRIVDQDWIVPNIIDSFSDGFANIDLDFKATPDMFEAAKEQGVLPQTSTH